MPKLMGAFPVGTRGALHTEWNLTDPIGAAPWMGTLAAIRQEIPIHVSLTPRSDTYVSDSDIAWLSAGGGHDDVTLNSAAWTVLLGGGNDRLSVTGPAILVNAGRGADDVTLSGGADRVYLGSGNDHLVTDAHVDLVSAGRGRDHIELGATAGDVRLGSGNDTLLATAQVDKIVAGSGRDEITLRDGAQEVSLGRQNDSLVAEGYVEQVQANRGDDLVRLESGAGTVRMGLGDDRLELTGLVDEAHGGRGQDTLSFEFNTGEVDIECVGGRVQLTHKFTGQEMNIRGFEQFDFADRSFTLDDMRTDFKADADTPYIQVAGGTQVLTVNNADPTISVVWDRVIQQAVIDTDQATGPTMASRAYAMMHTAMYDAWSSYDATAVRVAFDVEGDNLELTGSDAAKAKAMSFAAYHTLVELFPDQEELFRTVMEERLGYDVADYSSQEAIVGIDAADDLLASRSDDGSNWQNGYVGTYTPTNPNPLEINDITAWTPESTPIDPEDSAPEQSFLTPHWLEVEGFALAEDETTGETDFSATLPPAPEGFFTDAFANSTLDFAAKTITLDGPVTLNGVDYVAGDVIVVGKDLIGTVINQGFIDQAQRVVDLSANLTDEHKIIAEFWEDGGGTAYPPGTFMSFAQFVSARDNHSIDQDAALFLAMANAAMDAGIATWQAKVEYDYVRPVRVIRDLGELGLLGEWGFDELTGEEGYVIQAFGGFDENGMGLGTRTILADNFNTFQRPGADPSPPFAEYTSGHSGFSAAGAEVLQLFTGSDEFGGWVMFEPDTIQFENGVPETHVTLEWSTFTQAADQAGLSRLYGGIHFDDGDLNGRDLGRVVGADAYDLAMLFVTGLATDEDRPFYDFGLIG